MKKGIVNKIYIIAELTLSIESIFSTKDGTVFGVAILSRIAAAAHG